MASRPADSPPAPPPQVYVKGEFVGGCDIMIQMHQNGELVEALRSIGHESTFSTEDEE